MAIEPMELQNTRRRVRLIRAAILLAGLIAAQFALYAPSLLGWKVLLPLELLADPGTQGGGAGSGGVRLHDRLLTDPINQLEPMRRFAVSEVRAGRLPLWDPNNYCGAPFLAANQSAVFSPFRVLDYLWPDPWALAWGQMLRALAGGIGAYLFFRIAIRAQFWAAAMGGWIWPQSGFLVLWTMWPQSAAALWLPWVLLGVYLSMRSPWGWGVPMLGVFSAFTIISGHSATGAHVLLASGLYGIWLLWSWRRDKPLSGVLSVLMGWVLGGMLAAPQLLPTLEYMADSLRMSTRLSSGAESLPVGMAALPQLVFPWITGTTRVGWIYLNPDIPLDSAIGGYVGAIAVLVFAPVALMRRRAEAIFWLVLAVVGCAYILDLPGALWFHRLPVLSLLRGNRLVLATAFALLALSVMGMDALLRGKRSRWMVVTPVLSLIIAGWCIWRGFTISETISRHAAPMLEMAQGTSVGVFTATLRVIEGLVNKFQMLHFGYAAICMLAAGLGVILWKSPNRVLVIATSLFAVIEVTASAWSVNPQSDRALYDWKMPALERIAAAEPGRMCGVLCLPPMMPRWFGLSDIRGYDAVDPIRYMQVMQILAAPNSPPPDSVAATFAYIPKFPSKLADFMNLRYLIFRGQPADPTGVLFVTPDYFVVENKTVLPRVTVPKRAVAGRLVETLDGLAIPGFDPLETVYLDADGPTKGGIDGTATIVSEVPSEVRIDYTMRTDGYVVLADSWGAGWRATVNGKPVEVLRANHAFRAVFVPAGNGQIIFTYWPLSLTLGLGLAGLGILLLVLIPVVSRKMRGRDVYSRGSVSA